jgi:transcriptional regulator with XRE-family HTH domain
MREFYNKMGQRLRQLRERSGISQEKLAAMIELPRPAISQIERGERTITADELVKISKAFNVSIEAVLDLKKEPEVIIEAKQQQSKAKETAQIRISVPQKNLSHFKEVLLYILDKVGSKPNIGETVIYKLLYFIDFDYYEKYEEQLIGAQYLKNHYGPTPIEFKMIVDNMIESGDIEKVKSRHFQYPQTKYLPRRKPDLSRLPATGLQVIDNVLNRLSDKNAKEISEYSHGDVPWRTAAEGAVIEYEAVFYRTQPYSVREYPQE